MVEQEDSKSSTVFPESLTSKSISQNHSSNPWFSNDATSLIKPEGLCSSDMLSIELLYGNVLPANETFSSAFPDGHINEGNTFFHETLPNDLLLSVSDSTPCDLYYNDKNMSYMKDFWNPLSDKVSTVSDSYFEANSPLSFWGCCPHDLETLKMDEVFQVDKDDLVQSPTLAELNAIDESLFDSFDNFDVPSEQKCGKSLLAPSLSSSSDYKMSSLKEASQSKPNSEVPSDRTNLLLNMDTACEKESISDSEVRSGFNIKDKKINSVALESITSLEKPTVVSQVLTKVAKKPYPITEASIETSDRKSTESISEMSFLSNRESIDSEEDDSEMDCDYSSDVDEESDEEIRRGSSSKRVSSNNLLLQKKKSRYFWQYNIQSKGPKAPKVKLDEKSVITDSLSSISDPVFTSNYLKGIKHAGKARRGDGNDLTPNPQKLYAIGLELEKLTSVIEGLIPANELPISARSKSRKEKNKLASRACRLKKKAQHEANKLKLFGLQKEQKHLVGVISEVKKIIRKSADNINQGKVQSNVHSKVESLCMKKCFAQVAGCSAEFVNSVLKNVDSGDKSGGLDIETLDN